MLGLAARAIRSQVAGLACEVKEFQNISAQAKEVFAGALARAIQSDGDGSFDPPRPRGHDHDAVTHIDRFVDIVGNQEHRGVSPFPEPKYFILHSHARKSVECA
jgi:hypothetical protein